MKKLMLILLIAGNAYADDSNPYSFLPDWGKQAERAAQIRKDNAVADYLNRQPSQFNAPVYGQPSAVAPLIAPSFNDPAPSEHPNPFPVRNYGNQKREW